MKICVVDDESAVRAGIIFKLNSLSKPLDVFDVEFGQAALEKVRHIRPEIVITDILMPELTGLELLQQIKRELPATKVVLLSGYNEFEYARKALQLGATNYLLKPVDRGELLALVTAVELEGQERLAADVHTYAAQLSEHHIELELLSLEAADLWNDETAPKRIDLTDSDGDGISATGNLIFTFQCNRNINGAVRECSWTEPGCFTGKEQFVPALLKKLERWEATRFFGAAAPPHTTGEPQLKQAAQLRQAILHAVKEQDVPGLELQLSSYLHCVGGFSLKSLRKECSYLMAALDEALTTRYDITMVEENKLAYWTSWMEQHPHWSCLKERLTKFVLGGVKALAEVGQAEPMDLVDKAMQLVLRNIGGSISLESVAASLSVHSVTLSRIFKQHTGENFVRYVVRQKMKQAERLVLESDRKVGDIADEVGYADYRYFTLLFKQAYGLTPTDYRKKHRGAER
ncbi:response regulator transcription factor [Paenibacillus cremeus]|uniref:Response regulator n=1 Tax=Paenibacillus cremeus TaxID=2163881 RepID=A0A559K3X6_9BACL|nr:response regulator [Paenibacillus cremeus]TVY06845.1 response regulator [Paenibacillus cremeus]